MDKILIKIAIKLEVLKIIGDFVQTSRLLLSNQESNKKQKSYSSLSVLGVP
jgi:hypothetical protein